MIKHLTLIFLVFSLGCQFQWYRVKKVLSAREQVLDETFTAGQPLLRVQYRAGKGEPLLEYALATDPKTGKLRPPELYPRAVISLEVLPGVDPSSLELQIFIKSDVRSAGNFEEVRALTSELPGETANSVTFVEDLFPIVGERLLIYPDDIAGPYQGASLSSNDWLMLKISGPTGAQKIVFEYVKTGLRVSAGPHVLLSTGVNLLDLGVAQIEAEQQAILGEQRRAEFAGAPGQISPSEFDLALTLSVAFGYRAKSRGDALHWFGDNLELVLDVAIGSPGEIKSAFTGGEISDQVIVLQNQLLFGAGIQLFDFLSLHLLNNFFANVPIPGIEDVESVLIPEIGLDVATAVRFGSRLYERIFTSTARRSRREPLLVKTSTKPTTTPASAPSTAPTSLPEQP